MKRTIRLLARATILLTLAATAAHAQTPAPPKTADPSAVVAPRAEAEKARKLAFANKPWTGDFDAMLERRVVRVYIPYSRSLYFIEKGRERGLAAELIRDFEHWLNRKHARKLGKRPLTVYIGAATRDQLIDGLREGRIDMAVGNLTVTEERLELVDFVAPDERLVNREILVTGPASPQVASLDELSGKSVHVRASSSYHDSLAELNERFAKGGKRPAEIVLVPDALEDEDMLEMMNAALLQAMVVDEWKAAMWSQILPELKLHRDIVLREPTKKGWAIRKGSPKLAAEIEEFYLTWVKKAGVIPYRQKQYMKSVKALKNAADDADAKRFEQTVAFFETYGKRYNFDPLMLAAQGYQESGLDQRKRSRVGAVGVMQLMPATGQSLKVGDITVTEANIHAGAKYMDHLMERYFGDASFDEQNRTLFAFASYNAGPGRISQIRKETAKRGLDPNKWFNNVEIVTAEKIGMETTSYVRNIFKYYASYKLTQRAQAAAAKAREEVAKQN